MSSIIQRLKTEPAFLGGVLVALVGFGTSFGLALSGEQVGAITGLIGLLTGVGVRGQVYSAATMDALAEAAERDKALAGADAPDWKDAYVDPDLDSDAAQDADRLGPDETTQGY